MYYFQKNFRLEYTCKGLYKRCIHLKTMYYFQKNFRLEYTCKFMLFMTIIDLLIQLISQIHEKTRTV